MCTEIDSNPSIIKTLWGWGRVSSYTRERAWKINFQLHLNMILPDMIFKMCFFFPYSVEIHFRAMHQNRNAFASSPVCADERSYINTSPVAVKRKTHCPDRAEEPIKWTAFCFIPLQYWAAVLWELLLLKFNTPGLAGAADPLRNRPFTRENKGHSFACVCVCGCM